VTSGTTWTTWNLATKKPASILDAVDEASLLSALRSDDYVKEALGDQLEVLGTAQEVLASLDDHTEGQADFLAFAFQSYDVKKGKAKLELSFYRTWRKGTKNEPEFLTLTVVPRPEFRADFEQATKGKGLFTDNTKVDREIRGMTWMKTLQ
jgi:hypothetical protein